MIDPIITTFVSIISVTVIGIIGWFVKDILNKLHELQKALNEHIIEDTTIQTALQTTTDQMDKKLDKLIDKLI